MEVPDPETEPLSPPPYHVAEKTSADGPERDGEDFSHESMHGDLSARRRDCGQPIQNSRHFLKPSGSWWWKKVGTRAVLEFTRAFIGYNL